MAEEDTPSVMMHEFTHSMWIVDLYVYGKDGYNAGSGVGVWLNTDLRPFLDPTVDIDRWSKYLLGWVEAPEVNRDKGYTIHISDKPDESHGLLIPINEKKYYFIHALETGSQTSLRKDVVVESEKITEKLTEGWMADVRLILQEEDSYAYLIPDHLQTIIKS